MPPWTVSAGTVDWIDNGYWQAKAGLRSLDMSGTSPGAVSQTFDTTPGATYNVTFWMSGNPLGGPPLKTLTVVGGNSAAATFSYDTLAAGTTRTEMRYAAKAYSFTGACDARVTTLVFTSTIQGNSGPVLDDVKVNLATSQPANPCSPAPLCVVKFNDIDRNGTQGGNEPILTGWVFTIRDANGVDVGTIGTAPGLGLCKEVLPGAYTVTEAPQSGWAPTTPGGATQTVTVVSGQTTTVTFGNHQDPRGRLCVVKFNDLDGDGVRAGEPLLSGWAFTVVDTSSNAVAGTLVSGTPRNCLYVKPGTYTLTETMQPGWHATTAGGVTQTVTVAAGQTVDVTFGNHRCCLTFTYLGGKIDNFSIANGATAEPVAPASITAAPKYFDARVGDFGLFVHRFSLGAGNCIQSATLELKLKALAGGSSNDTLGIKVAGSSGWSRPISSIAPLVGSWTPSKVKTVLFNLGAMPAGGGSANLIPALNAIRLLDVTIQDDTSVDYARLIVVFCECTPK